MFVQGSVFLHNACNTDDTVSHQELIEPVEALFKRYPDPNTATHMLIDFNRSHQVLNTLACEFCTINKQCDKTRDILMRDMMIFQTAENERLEVLQSVGKRRWNVSDWDSSLTTDPQTKYVKFFFSTA